MPGTTTAPLRRLALAVCAATVLAPAAVLLPTAEAASTPVVRWSSDTRVRAGARVLATVKPRSVPHGATPVLQRRFPDGWRAADRTAKRTDDGLRFRVPTDQFGRFTYRVAARRDGEVVSASEEQRVRVKTSWDPRGRASQHRFLYDQRTRWNTCRTVRWTFNDDLAPRRGLRQVKKAVRRVHAATGLEFEYQGKTDHRSNPYGDDIPGAALVVGWRSARTFQRYVGSPQVVGLAGQRFVTGYRDADGPVYKTRQAGVILNAGHHLARGCLERTTARATAGSGLRP